MSELYLRQPKHQSLFKKLGASDDEASHEDDPNDEDEVAAIPKAF